MKNKWLVFTCLASMFRLMLGLIVEKNTQPKWKQCVLYKCTFDIGMFRNRFTWVILVQDRSAAHHTQVTHTQSLNEIRVVMLKWYTLIHCGQCVELTCGSRPPVLISTCCSVTAPCNFQSYCPASSSNGEFPNQSFRSELYKFSYGDGIQPSPYGRQVLAWWRHTA